MSFISTIDAIVDDLVAVVKVFNKFFKDIFDNIGFSDPILVDYTNDYDFWSLVSEYDTHMIIIW